MKVVSTTMKTTNVLVNKMQLETLKKQNENQPKNEVLFYLYDVIV